MSNHEYEKLNDLLADRAMYGLSEEEKRELEKLHAQYPEFEEEEFERAAAAIQLTQAMKPETLPNHLRNKLMTDAEDFFGKELPSNVVTFPIQKIKHNYWQMAGWYAAAACLVLSLMVGWFAFKERPNSIDMAANRSLLLQDTHALRQNWTATKYPGVELVQGDVVWSTEKQQGYMRFNNLAANDPNQSVYQLWIFDENQDEKYPVDGGVFNVTKSGEIIVPINAKLKIEKPTLFAITIEKPGGVVVSKRDKLILTAKI